MQPQVAASLSVDSRAGTASFLEGFVGVESHALIQENVYVILGHGRFQQLVLLSTILSLTVLLMHAFAYRLIGQPVDHWCQPPPYLRDLPVQQWKNAAIPILADGSFSKCTVYDPPILDESQEERHEIRCDGWDYKTADVGNSIISMWDLVCKNTWLLSVSKSVYTLGSLCLVPVAGIMADLKGRRPVMLVSAAATLLASMAAASTHAFGVFLMSRFVVSGGSSATNVINFIVLHEVTGNGHRALYILLACSIGGIVTPGLYSVLSPLHPTWRLSQALLVSSAAMVLAWCYAMDESPVWQLATWRFRQAEYTVLHAVKANGVDEAKARYTFRALVQQLEKRHTTSDMRTGISERISHAATFGRYALSIFVCWFGVSFAYYGARMVRGSLEGYWKALAHLFKIVLLIVVYYGMKHRGQRATLSAVLALLFVCGVFQTVSYALESKIAMPLSTLTVFSATTAAVCVTYGYTAEVFPTSVRSFGFCLSYSIGRMGVLLATLISAFVKDQHVLVLNITLTILSFVSGVAIQWLPEILAQQKKDPDPATLDERQRKEALKERLDPLSIPPKGGKSSHLYGHRKPKLASPNSGGSAPRTQ